MGECEKMRLPDLFRNFAFPNLFSSLCGRLFNDLFHLALAFIVFCYLCVSLGHHPCIVILWVGFWTLSIGPRHYLTSKTICFQVQHARSKKCLQGLTFTRMTILFESFSQGLHPVCQWEGRLLISPKELQCLKRRLKLSWYVGTRTHFLSSLRFWYAVKFLCFLQFFIWLSQVNWQCICKMIFCCCFIGFGTSYVSATADE